MIFSHYHSILFLAKSGNFVIYFKIWAFIILQHKMRLAIATHSPYIVNYLNLLAARADSPQNDGETSLPIDKICVYHVEDGYAYSLKITSTNGSQIINTRVLSDPISAIYRSYNQILEQKNGKAVE